MLDATNKNSASISTTDFPSVFQMSDIIEDSQVSLIVYSCCTKFN